MRTPLPRTVRHVLLAIPLLFAPAASAQRPAHYEHRDADLMNALDLFGKAKYGAAQYEFQRVIERIPDRHDGARVEAEFHSALCAVRLFNDDAGYRLLTFMDEHPEDLHVPVVRFELFKHMFAQKKWDDAIAWSDQVDRFTLSPEETEEYRFKRGYSYFQLGDREKALGEFAQVTTTDGIYGAPSLYYTSHIQYEKGNHGTALAGFRRLENDENFSKVVPFYIAEILFLQGKYEELNAYVGPLLENPGTKRLNEMNRLAGEANYRTGNYAAALPYLQKSAQRAGVDRDDRYILGYTYYRTGDFRKALAELTIVANGEDSLAQLAVYHMADCYLRLNEKNYARNAFKRAYELGGDPKVGEDALFQYAKLSYELSFDPYNEAIAALKSYLKAYPNTPRRDEAYEFLLNVYLKTRNYEDALASLDEIQNKDMRLKGAYQMLAYNRGVELYEGRKYADAALFFERALKYPVDQGVNARAHFWMAESHYGMGDLTGALRKYDDLRNAPGSYSTDLYEQAGYGMGYAFFKLGQYGEAVIAFRRYVGSRQGEARQRADAMLRVGDCYFVTKDNEQAVKWYDDAMRTGSPDHDYAQYQKGACLGLLGRNTEKIATLKGLLSEVPGSGYAADARFQLGETYIFLDNDAEALKYHTQVIEQHPNSPLVHRSMLQAALIHQRQGRTDQAIAQYKAIVAKYPTVDGSRDALAGLKNIHIELGRVAEYDAYVRTLSFVDPSTLGLDEDYYESAEKLYQDGKCGQAVGAFGDYLNKYPDGAFALNAYYYRGDCHYRAGRYQQALPDLEEVIRRNGKQFMEKTLIYAGDILYRDERWEGALEHFKRLEPIASFPQSLLGAQLGQMRCLNGLGRADEAARAAEKVAANPDASADMKAEAGLLIAKDLLGRDELDAAYGRFKGVSAGSTGAPGAEAKYHMAYVRYLQGQYRKAETEVFELLQKYAGHGHWKARALILLGDVYVRLDDRFQAKAALQGVIDNCPEPDLVAEARRRLADINAGEVQRGAPAQEEDLTIPLPGGTNDR